MNRREWLIGTGALMATLKTDGLLQASSLPAGSGLGSKADFPLAQTRTYLNNASFHPISTPARRTVEDYLAWRNEGSRTPAFNDSADVKKSFAGLINAAPDTICYVTSTTVGENLVVSGLGLMPPFGGRAGAPAGNVVTDALHFEGSLYHYQTLQQQYGLDLRVVKPRDWRIDLADLEKVIDRNTKLVAVSLVSFINGFQHDLKAVCDLAHAHGAYVYADIIQAAGAIPIDVQASGVDFCACSSYKWLMGDFGLGFFYIREDLLDTVMPRVRYGWRQLKTFQYHMLPYDPPGDYPASWEVFDGAPGHFEMGTFSRTAEACLTHSLKHIRKLGVENIQAHTQSLIQRLQKELPGLGFEPLTPPESRSPIVAFVVKDPETIADRLKKANVEVKFDRHYMRVSPSIYNDQRDIDRLLEALS